jgi:hypothetical protein
MSAVKSGTPLDFMKQVTFRTLCDCISQERSPVKRRARNEDLLVNIDRKLSQRIVRLQQVRLGVRRNHIRRFAVQIGAKQDVNVNMEW